MFKGCYCYGWRYFCFKQTTFKTSMFISVYYHTGLLIKTALAQLPVGAR